MIGRWCASGARTPPPASVDSGGGDGRGMSSEIGMVYHKEPMESKAVQVLSRPPSDAAAR